MGSFTPLGAACCGWLKSWGIFTSVLIVASPTWSYLIFFDDSRVSSVSGDCHQFRRLGGFAHDLFRFFPHVRYLDALEHRFDTVVHLAQRFANVAAVALIALSAHRHARRDKKRTVDGLNHLESRDRMRRPRQGVSAVDAVLRM